MIKKQILNKVAIVAMGLTLFACNEDATVVEEEAVVEAVDSAQVEVEMDEFGESPDVDYHLPSALQVASIFKKSGLSYNPDATNSVENVAAYTSDTKGKLNFGVYSADLAYCIANEESNDARKFVTAVQLLAEQQGMEAVFENKSFMERFDSNLENQDSVQSMIVEIHEKSQEYLEDNEMTHVAAIHYAGAWSEGMYLGVNDYENNPDVNKESVGFKLTEQMEILKNIIKGLEDPKNENADLDWVITDLKAIQTSFDGFESVKAYLASDDSEELMLTDDEIMTLGSMIKDIRLKIVEK